MFADSISSQPVISIHAPLTGSDPRGCPCFGGFYDFNPRSPYGERRPGAVPVLEVFMISIHAPLTGSDSKKRYITISHVTFQSTLPLRGATATLRSFYSFWGYFNPRSPYGERPPNSVLLVDEVDFNPRSPYGERPANRNKRPHTVHFNPRSPYGERRSRNW